jgi:hypothetical protein
MKISLTPCAKAGVSDATAYQCGSILIFVARVWESMFWESCPQVRLLGCDRLMGQADSTLQVKQGRVNHRVQTPKLKFKPRALSQFSISNKRTYLSRSRFPSTSLNVHALWWSSLVGTLLFRLRYAMLLSIFLSDQACLRTGPNITRFQQSNLLPSNIDSVPNLPFLILFGNLKNVRLQVPNILRKRTGK